MLVIDLIMWLLVQYFIVKRSTNGEVSLTQWWNIYRDNLSYRDKLVCNNRDRQYIRLVISHITTNVVSQLVLLQ